MIIPDSTERMFTARTRAELIDVAAAAASEVVSSDGVRIARARMESPVTYQVMARSGPAPDPSPSIVRSPLSSPLVAEYAHSHFDRWLSMHDLLPGGLWTAHPFYREVYRPLGLSAQITAPLYDTGNVVYALSLHRAGRDFDERERDQLEQFRRLVRSAWLRVQEAEAIRSFLDSLCDQRGEDALVVLTPDPLSPRVVYCTEAMRSLLSRHAELWEPIKRAGASVHNVGGRISTPVNPALRLVAVHTGDAVVVRAVSAPFADLTERERQILTALATGRTAHAIGHQLGISEATVRKHLEHLYAKIGVHDRVEAVVLARHAGLS